MKEALLRALSLSLGKEILRADAAWRQLQGGDVGDVRLIEGLAQTADGEELPYRLVLKTQKKWERYADPASWRREYDLYQSALDGVFTERLRWPKCYLAEFRDHETRLWLEYIEGTSGNALTADTLERAAEELGRFQGGLCAMNFHPESITNLNDTDSLQNGYRWSGPGSAEHTFVRSEDCPIPEPLRRMLIHMDEEASAWFERLQKLPVVLCHKDFWLENIFCTDGACVLIDWDTAGWGFLGEDIASLIADDTDAERFHEYYNRFIPAYYRGVAEKMDVSGIRDDCILEMILLKFGYRFVHRYMRSQSQTAKQYQIRALEMLHLLLQRKQQI